jgi:hemoglobin
MVQQDSNPNAEQATLYQRVGGLPFFIELVDRFYKLVEMDSVLRPLYPEDLEPGKAHLALFLAQYWGGPPQYSLERGHPRLRRRHMPFSIGQAERDAWVAHMTSSVRSTDVSIEDAALMTDYFENTATLMMNRQ